MIKNRIIIARIMNLGYNTNRGKMQHFLLINISERASSAQPGSFQLLHVSGFFRTDPSLSFGFLRAGPTSLSLCFFEMDRIPQYQKKHNTPRSQNALKRPSLGKNAAETLLSADKPKSKPSLCRFRPTVLLHVLAVKELSGGGVPRQGPVTAAVQRILLPAVVGVQGIS